jgi:multiple sugar transport system permease protein
MTNLTLGERLVRPRVSQGAGGRATPLQQRRAIIGAAFVSPAVIFLVLFFVLPMGLLVWMSFHNWPLLGRVSFIDFRNYEAAFSDAAFGQALWFTTIFTVISTPVQVLIGYGLAIVVRTPLRATGLFRTIYFMPVVIGTAAASYMFVVMLQPGTGLLDAILTWMGLTDGRTPVVTNWPLAVTVVVLVTAWKNVGTAMIIFMAGMQSIPEDLYEAAKLDGAGWFGREWFVTLPLVKQSMALVLIITITGSFLAFDQFWIITRGGPSGTTVTAVLWIYTVGFVRYRLGYSAALAILLVIMLVVASVFQLRILRQRSKEA